MDENNYYRNLGRLVDAFRNGRALTDDQAVMLYKEVRRIPNEAFDHIVDRRIATMKWTYQNFPTPADITRDYHLWLNDHPHIVSVDYDPVEDFRYPVGKLEEGFRVLDTHGKEQFLGWAKHNRMPRNDIERVLSKHSMVNRSVEKLAGGIGERI